MISGHDHSSASARHEAKGPASKPTRAQRVRLRPGRHLRHQHLRCTTQGRTPLCGGHSFRRRCYAPRPRRHALGQRLRSSSNTRTNRTRSDWRSPSAEAPSRRDKQHRWATSGPSVSTSASRSQRDPLSENLEPWPRPSLRPSVGQGQPNRRFVTARDESS